MTTLEVDHELRLRQESPSHAADSAEVARYVVERRDDAGWSTVGRAVLSVDHLELSIDEPHRREGIGRRVVLRLADRARVLGWSELRVREAADDAGSHALLRSLGFVARADGPPAYVLRLAPLGGRPRR